MRRKRGNRLPHSTKQRTVALFLQCLDRLLRQCGAVALELFKAGIEVDEGELQPERGRERLEDASPGGDDLSPNAVARYEAYKPSVPSHRGALRGRTCLCEVFEQPC